MDKHPLPDGGRHGTITSDDKSYSICIRAWTDRGARYPHMLQRIEDIMLLVYYQNQEATLILFSCTC